uniref:Uncharacterized protein n=1 Tax=Opuntia streptacantha TaxID=393608 RepID=A0A7C8YY99_OPUST
MNITNVMWYKRSTSISWDVLFCSLILAPSSTLPKRHILISYVVYTGNRHSPVDSVFKIASMVSLDECRRTGTKSTEVLEVSDGERWAWLGGGSAVAVAAAIWAAAW